MSFDDAARDWARILGPDRVLTDPADRARYARTTQAFAATPRAVVLPATTAEVAEVVRVAAREGVGLHPISTGKNWGMGAASPMSDDHVVVDLHGMDAILEIDEELGYAVVQPGVTQGQLAARLEELGSRWILDTTASARDTSLLGNIVDRGDAFGRLSDRYANCAGLEVVLGDGTVLDTGYAHYDCGPLRHAHKWGVGPALDGLFSQSNLGVVTRLAMWLSPKPEHVLGVILHFRDPALPAVIDGLRALRQRGVIDCAPHIYNGLRVAGPSAVSREGAFDLEAERAASGRSFDWLASFALYGTRAQTRVAMRLVAKTLRGHAKVVSFSRRSVRVFGWAAKLFEMIRLRGLAGVCRANARGLGVLLDSFSGMPNDGPVSGVAASSRHLEPGATPTPDLLAYPDLGMYWLTHAAPLRGQDAAAAAALIRETLRVFRVPPHLTFTPVSARALLLNVTIYFDRDDPARRDAAHRCQDVLSERLGAAGYPPFRAGVHGARHLASAGNFWPIVQRIRAALDPAGILSPGRYDPLRSPSLRRPENSDTVDAQPTKAV